MIKLDHGEQDGLVKVHILVVGSIICKFLRRILEEKCLFLNTSRVPFQKSIRITGRLPAGSGDNKIIWIIVRGTENLPTSFQGFQLPPNARLILQKNRKSNI